MSTKTSRHQFHFSFTVIFRLLIFIFITYLIISYLSSVSNPSKIKIITPNISTEFYNRLPSSSRQMLENLNSQPIMITLQKKFDFLKEESSGFPQKQITNLKRSIIQSIYQDIMKNYGN